MAISATEQVTTYISGFTDWRGKLLADLRKLFANAEPGLVEEWKWGVPVWSLHGNVLAAAAFQEHVKVNFFKGASLDDPQGLFNAGLDAKATRAIDFHKGDKLNAAALTALVHAAVALNGKKKPARKSAK